MSSITISLIRQAYGGASADELSRIEVLNLAGVGITVIDNLEVFAEIKELHLNNNSICCIENINFMYNLDYLDVSNNSIESNDIFRCIKDRELPSCLKTINLTGNPCANDDRVLGLLQESYNELNIIIGIEEDDSGSNNFEPEMDEDNSDNNDDDDKGFELQPGQVLDADAVLKSLVERKCQLDKLKDFNIDGAIDQLNGECDNAISTRVDNINNKMIKSVYIKDKIRNTTDGYFEEMVSAKDRVGKMLDESRNEKNEMSNFMLKLRERSLLLREEVFSKISEDSQLP
jgi:hypothetical protein